MIHSLAYSQVSDRRVCNRTSTSEPWIREQGLIRGGRIGEISPQKMLNRIFVTLQRTIYLLLLLLLLKAWRTELYYCNIRKRRFRIVEKGIKIFNFNYHLKLIISAVKIKFDMNQNQKK